MTTEWTDLSCQQAATQGKAAFIVFPVAIMLAFLVLAALYELVAAAGGDPDRADDPAVRVVRRVADRR